MTITNVNMRKIVLFYQAFLVDVWGVLRDSSTTYKEAIAVLKEMKKQKKEVLIFSNSSNSLPHEIANDLEKAGFACNTEHVITSGMALKSVFEEKGLIGKQILNVGEAALGEYIKKAGGENSLELDRIEASVLGLYTPSEEWWRNFCLAVYLAKEKQIPCILSNPDVLVPFSRSEIIIGPGTWGEVFEEMTGTEIIKTGKPYPYMYKLALEKLRRKGIKDLGSILAIGDTLETDILGACNQNLDSLLVLSGLEGMLAQGKNKDYEAEKISPTYILPALAF